MRDARIEIPAHEIESRRRSQCFDLSTGLLFNVQESNHHIGNLRSVLSM